jgi:hypothetical protein
MDQIWSWMSFSINFLRTHPYLTTTTSQINLRKRKIVSSASGTLVKKSHYNKNILKFV